MERYYKPQLKQEKIRTHKLIKYKYKKDSIESFFVVIKEDDNNVNDGKKT